VLSLEYALFTHHFSVKITEAVKRHQYVGLWRQQNPPVASTHFSHCLLYISTVSSFHAVVFCLFVSYHAAIISIGASLSKNGKVNRFL
jgi:hypothetical protein